jgi:ABC-type multidrug transport system permease subunit
MPSNARGVSMSFLLLLFFVAVIAMWGIMFANLMLFTDAQLPGTYDKLFWVAAFLLMAPLAPFAFWIFKRDCQMQVDTEHVRNREGDRSEVVM